MIAHCLDRDDYSAAAVWARIFRGTSPAAAAETFAELVALGDGPAGCRLRALFERLVVHLQLAAYVHHGSLIGPDGRPMNNREIAQLVAWDATAIGADLRELARA